MKIFVLAVLLLSMAMATIRTANAQSDVSTKQSSSIRDAPLTFVIDHYETDDEGSITVFNIGDSELAGKDLSADARIYSQEGAIASVSINATAGYSTSNHATDANLGSGLAGFFGLLSSGIANNGSAEKAGIQYTAKVKPLRGQTFRSFTIDNDKIGIVHRTGNNFRLSLITRLFKRDDPISIDFNNESDSTSIKTEMLSTLRKRAFQILTQEVMDQLQLRGVAVIPPVSVSQGVHFESVRTTFAGKRIVANTAPGPRLKIGDEVSIGVVFEGSDKNKTVIGRVLTVRGRSVQIQLEGYDGQEYTVGVDDEVIILSRR